MIIREHNLDIDFLEELEQFPISRQRIRGNKLQGCSPFRQEKSPSFAVNLENGTWIDSGASSEYYRKGNFVSLLAYLRNEEYSDTEDYLIEKYATILADTEALQLHLNLYGETEKPRVFSREELSHLWVIHYPYLDSRGISEEVQKLFNTGFDKERKSVALVWQDKRGNIVNVKYRRIDKKDFFYEKAGQPVKKFVYGIYQCIRAKAKRVYICESEIDALTLWTYGIPAIAVGGSSLSEAQKQIILSSGIEELVIATDNDVVGKRFGDFLLKEFAGNLIIYKIDFPGGIKDINELSQDTKNFLQIVHKVFVCNLTFI